MKNTIITDEIIMFHRLLRHWRFILENFNSLIKFVNFFFLH